MGASFLGRLISYAPREGRVAREDFFTEAFAGLISLDGSLLPSVLAFGHARGRIRDGWRLPPDDLYEVETQFARMTRGRPDMAVLVGNLPRLIIESKLWAGFTGDATDGSSTGRESQIPYYVREVAERGWPAKVLLVSLYSMDVPPVAYPDVYLGNLLWSDVFEGIGAAVSSRDPRANVLRRELLNLMEDLHMTPTEPLRFGDGESYWRYKDLKARMGSLLDRVVANLTATFAVEVKTGGRPGDAYDYRHVRAGGLALDIGLIASARDEQNRPVWLVLHVHPESSDSAARDRAHETLGAQTSDLGAAWPGKIVYPTEEQLAHLLGAWDWEHQVREATSIVTAWFEKLASAGIVTRTPSSNP